MRRVRVGERRWRERGAPWLLEVKGTGPEGRCACRCGISLGDGFVILAALLMIGAEFKLDAELWQL